MLTKREFLQASVAAAAIFGAGGKLARAAAHQKISEDDLLAFDPLGQATILHVTDIHAHLTPVYFREPSINLGVGDAKGQPPHVVGKDYLGLYGLEAGTPEAYALTPEDFVGLARSYGKLGGLDRTATVVKAVRAERGDGNVLLLDGGDTWQGSYTSLKTEGADMIEAMTALGVEAMTGHWEFTYGAEKVQAHVENLAFPFLAGNVVDTDWEEPVFESTKMFEKGGVKIAVIGQAFPYTPVANPRYMVPEWSFGIREEAVREHVEAARADGAEVVVLLSHNGFDVDRKLAANVAGIDFILTGHTHDALPRPLMVGKTALIASGSHGKFIARLDLDVAGGELRGFRHKLIPIFSDAIRPDAEMAALIQRLRAPHADYLATEIGRTEALLYRRGNFNGSFDDLICEALIEQRDAEIALSPGFRWGASLLPGQAITVEDVFSETAMTYPQAYRTAFKGSLLKEVLEDVADNLFNPDPYYQQGGDMVRVGGLGYTIDISQPIGKRISNMTFLKDGGPIDPDREYVVAGWASVNPDVEGPPIWDVVMDHIKAKGVVRLPENDSIRVKGA